MHGCMAGCVVSVVFVCCCVGGCLACCLSVSLALEGDEGNEHFFHGDASVLEGVAVVTDVVVVVVGIGEEGVVLGKDVGGGDVGRG